MKSGRELRKDLSAVFFILVAFFLVTACSRSENAIRSVYVGTCRNITVEEITNTLSEYGANAVVIDVKDDYGQLFPSLPIAFDSRNVFYKNPKLQTLLQQLKEKKIYTIARIVTLKEAKRPDLCVKDENGGLWIDKEKKSWMLPNDERVQRYLEDVCTAAIKIGFDEVQLDYIRFSSYFKRENRGASRINAINELVERLNTAVHKVGGKMSVCVFGCTIEGSVDTPDRQNQTRDSAFVIGQDFIEIAKRCDFICPMIYPSHYPNDTPRGIKYPDLEPYNTIKICLDLCNDMLKKEKHVAVVRPYLQAFTATWLKKHKTYDRKAIQEQINATYDSNFSQWGLFNMKGQYPFD